MQIKQFFLAQFLFFFSLAFAQPGFSKTEFYKVLRSENADQIDSQLRQLKQIGNLEAFSGALLIKKSGLPGNAKDKLSLFKQGHNALESAIKKDSSSAEFRLLRLIIQENTPKMLKYSGEIKKDASYLRRNFKNLPPSLQKEIVDYSKSSKELKPEDFNSKSYE